MSPLLTLRRLLLVALVVNTSLFIASVEAAEPNLESSTKPFRVAVRITSPNGVLLQTTLPADGAFQRKVAFVANGYRRGMHGSDVQISGQVEADDSGILNYRAQCIEDRPQGRYGHKIRYYDSFWGNLKNGRHLSQPISGNACRGVLVDVALVTEEKAN